MPPLQHENLSGFSVGGLHRTRRLGSLRQAVVASGCAPDPRSSAACFRAMAHLAPKTRRRGAWGPGGLGPGACGGEAGRRHDKFWGTGVGNYVLHTA